MCCQFLMVSVSRPFFFLMIRRPPRSTLFPYTRSSDLERTTSSAGSDPHPARRRQVRAGLPGTGPFGDGLGQDVSGDRKSTRLNSSHDQISYAVFCLKKKNKYTPKHRTCDVRASSADEV